MMKHSSHRGITVVRHRLPTLVIRGDENVLSSDIVGATQESPVVSPHNMPTSTMAAVIVVTIVGFLAIMLTLYFVHRSRKSRRQKAKRIISSPLNAKHVNHDTVSDISEPKRTLTRVASDGTSLWRHATNDDDKYAESAEGHSRWTSPSSEATEITIPKTSLKKKPSKMAASIQRRLSRLGVPPPPSYSAAFAGIGGVDEEMMAMKLPVPSSTSTPMPEARMEPRSPTISSTFKLEGSSSRPSRTASIIKLVSSSLEAVSNSPRASSTPASAPTSLQLMTVINTFAPTLDDELPLTIGDTVRMLEEFKDGWCNVQYLGKENAARGAVPRFCLEECHVVPSR